MEKNSDKSILKGKYTGKYMHILRGDISNLKSENMPLFPLGECIFLQKLQRKT
jgi:hypothetical protein